MLRSILIDPGEIRFEQVETPVPRKGEVLIHMELAGICGSDLQMFRNGHGMKSPLTMGHEGMGRIEGLGTDVPAERLGERVVIEPNIPCSDCPECVKGKGNVCRNKRIIGVTEPGCFAEYLTIPAEFAHCLPDIINDEDAVTIEPAAVALAALKRSTTKPPDPIAVIGMGTIGMLLGHLAISLGHKVLFSEVESTKIEQARAMGAEHVMLGGSPHESAEILAEAFREGEVAAVFECTGNPVATTQAIDAAPRGAPVILLGMSREESSFRSHTLLRKGNQIIPSLIYDHPADFQRSIQLVENGLINPGRVISGFFTLNRLQEALEKAQKSEQGKIVIRISGN